MLQVNLGIILYSFKMDINKFCAKDYIVLFIYKLLQIIGIFKESI